MTTRRTAFSALIAAGTILPLCLSLTACGSKRAAVIVETVTATTPASQQPAAAPRSRTPTTRTPGSPPTAARTRTATAPAFIGATGGTAASGPASSDLAAALGSLRARGFTPTGTTTYAPNETLRVLVGSRSGREQAFFFDGARYLGTDSASTSRAISVVGQTDTEVTLRYATSGGPRNVRFELDMGHLTPLDPIPPAPARG